MKTKIATIVFLLSTTLTNATTLKPEITCYSGEFSASQWGAVCNNNKSDITVNGPATCSSMAPSDGLYSQTATLDTQTDDEDMIYCWCQISAPFTSQYIYINEYVYQTECENWCASFCAQNATQNQKFRDAIFSNLTPNEE